MRLTVLGKSPAWQDAGGACSGYLVEAGSYKLLIDCGNGVFGKLREQIDYLELDEILISHLHADHVLDLVPFAYALTLPERETAARPRLLLPPGAAAGLDRLTELWGSGGLIDKAFEVGEYERGGGLELGPIAARLHEVPHFALTHAVELIAPSGRRLVYGSDCRAGPELEEAARGADVLLAEATLPAPHRDHVPASERGHMSASEAAGVAARAAVGRLVLTHISDELDPEAAVAAARAEFEGEVELAAPGSSWEL